MERRYCVLCRESMLVYSTFLYCTVLVLYSSIWTPPYSHSRYLVTCYSYSNIVTNYLPYEDQRKNRDRLFECAKNHNIKYQFLIKKSNHESIPRHHFFFLSRLFVDSIQLKNYVDPNLPFSESLFRSFVDGASTTAGDFISRGTCGKDNPRTLSDYSNYSNYSLLPTTTNPPTATQDLLEPL